MYRLLPSAWGKGDATEAALALPEFGFCGLKLEEIIRLAFLENKGSRRILDKAEMRYLGIASYSDIDGLGKYVATRETWAPQRLK